MFISSFISLSKTAWNLFYLFRNILFEIPLDTLYRFDNKNKLICNKYSKASSLLVFCFGPSLLSNFLRQLTQHNSILKTNFAFKYIKYLVTSFPVLLLYTILTKESMETIFKLTLLFKIH